MYWLRMSFFPKIQKAILHWNIIQNKNITDSLSPAWYIAQPLKMKKGRKATLKGMQVVFNLVKQTNCPGQELSPYVSVQCLTQQSYYPVEPPDPWTTPTFRILEVKGKAEALNWFSLGYLISSDFCLCPLHLTVLKIQGNPTASYIRETMLLSNTIF